MIGDTPNDILAAKAAGVIGIGIPAPKETANPDVLKSFSEFGANYVLSSIQELRLLVP
jgi:phosphoglycolate phosphatase-like HAD superfamily hydrolase